MYIFALFFFTFPSLFNGSFFSSVSRLDCVSLSHTPTSVSLASFVCIVRYSLICFVDCWKPQMNSFWKANLMEGSCPTMYRTRFSIYICIDMYWYAVIFSVRATNWSLGRRLFLRVYCYICYLVMLVISVLMTWRLEADRRIWTSHAFTHKHKCACHCYPFDLAVWRGTNYL